MTRAELEIAIRLNFEILYPGKTSDIRYPNDDQIYVYVDGLMFDATLYSDDDGFLYFIPVVAGIHAPDLAVRIRYL